MEMRTPEELPIDLNINEEKLDSDSKKLKQSVLILGASGVTAIIAGIIAGQKAKKKSDEYYKDLNINRKIVLESPISLALRALAWSTVLSVSFCTVLVFGACKWFGISSLDDLRRKIKENRKTTINPNERTEFENLTDFLSYLNETYKSK